MQANKSRVGGALQLAAARPSLARELTLASCRTRPAAVTALNLQRLLLHPFQVIFESSGQSNHSSSARAAATPAARAPAAEDVDEAGHPSDEHWVPLRERGPGQGRYDEAQGAEGPGAAMEEGLAGEEGGAQGGGWELLDLGASTSGADALLGLLSAGGVGMGMMGQGSGLWDLGTLGDDP